MISAMGTPEGKGEGTNNGGIRITFTANSKRQKGQRDHAYPAFVARYF